jgi:hypothetical protein
MCVTHACVHDYTGGADKVVVLWSMSDFTPVGAIACVSTVGVLQFMGQSHILLAGVFDFGVVGLDCTSGETLKLFADHPYAVWGIAYGMNLFVH